MAGKVFLVQSEGLGRGEDELGKLLMANLLRLLGESAEKPAQIIFWNTGVRLLCEGSPVLGHITKLQQQGVEVLACTTCLEYLELTDKLRAGKPTTMVKSSQAMLGAEVVSL